MSSELEDVKDESNQIGIRLREEVQRVGGVARADEVVRASRATIYNWFESGLIPATELHALSRIGVDVLYVLTGQRNLMEAQSSALEKSARAINTVMDELEGGLIPKIRVRWMNRTFLVDPNEYRWVPLLDVRVAAGIGKSGEDENVIAFNAWRKDWLERKGLSESTLSEVIVDGPSMEPVLRDGEPVLVDHSATEIRGGDIYVLRLGRDLVVKYVQLLPNGYLQVSSENSSAFPPYTVEDCELGESVHIIGRVVPRGTYR